MRSDTVEQLHSVVIDALPAMATSMNVAMTDVQADILADSVAFGLDEGSIGRLLSEQFTEDDLHHVGELMAKQLRHLYFLQVGVELGLRLGYTAPRDGAQMQQLGESFNAAFERTLPARSTEKVTLPPLEEFVVGLFAKGFEYCHVAQANDGVTIAEWRRVWRDGGDDPRNRYEVHRMTAEGPAVTRSAHDGTVLFEEYVEQGRTHRADGPAVILRNQDGDITTEYYYRHGKLHRDDGPAVIEYDDQGAAIRFAIFYVDGLEHRENGPSLISLGGEENAIHLVYRQNGSEHRPGGKPSTITIERASLQISEHYFEHGLPRIDAPACVTFNRFGNLVGEVWYRAYDGLAFHPHREDGPAYWRIDFGRLQIDYHVNGKLHRADGPAHLTFDLDGRPSGAGWYRDGESHRDEGPSGVWCDGNGNWIESYCRNGIERQPPSEAGDWLKPTSPLNVPEPDLAFAREVLSRWRLGNAHG